MSQLFLDTLYPVRCVNCDVSIRSNALMLCYSCQRQLPVASERVMRSVLISDGDLDVSIDWDISHVLWYYESHSPTRVLQHRLKYGGYRRLAVHLGNLLAKNVSRSHTEKSRFDIIVPIPIHRVRLLERGYNQAAEIARGVSEVLNLPVEERALKRRFLSQSQVQSRKEDREENLRHAFSLASGLRIFRGPCPDRSLAGKKILLIDDVMTTGATIRNAILTLSRANVSSVGVAVLFAVPPDPV